MQNAVTLRSKCRMALMQLGLAPKPKRGAVLEELSEVMQQLKIAEARFNMESDRDLVEANIYDMKALQSRLKYLIERAKKENVTGSVLYSIDFEKE